MSLVVEVTPMILPILNKSDKVLIKVDVSGMSKEQAGEYRAAIYEQMKVKFQGNPVIVHPSNIEFFILPDVTTDYPKSKTIMVADL